MARILEELPKATRGGGGGRKETYPFDEWLDGQPRELVDNEDYQSKRQTMGTLIRGAAKRRNTGVKIINTEAGIAVQAIPVEQVKTRKTRSDKGKSKTAEAVPA